MQGPSEQDLPRELRVLAERERMLETLRERPEELGELRLPEERSVLAGAGPVLGSARLTPEQLDSHLARALEALRQAYRTTCLEGGASAALFAMQLLAGAIEIVRGCLDLASPEAALVHLTTILRRSGVARLPRIARPAPLDLQDAWDAWREWSERPARAAALEAADAAVALWEAEDEMEDARRDWRRQEAEHAAADALYSTAWYEDREGRTTLARRGLQAVLSSCGLTDASDGAEPTSLQLAAGLVEALDAGALRSDALEALDLYQDLLPLVTALEAEEGLDPNAPPDVRALALRLLGTGVPAPRAVTASSRARIRELCEERWAQAERLAGRLPALTPEQWQVALAAHRCSAGRRFHQDAREIARQALRDWVDGHRFAALWDRTVESLPIADPGEEQRPVAHALMLEALMGLVTLGLAAPDYGLALYGPLDLVIPVQSLVTGPC